MLSGLQGTVNPKIDSGVILPPLSNQVAQSKSSSCRS